MQGQGRGFSAPPGYDGRGGMAFGFGMNYFSAPEDYGLWGFGFPPQPLPPPPPLPRPAVYGSRGSPRPPVSLGVQGGGILKRPAGAAQGPLFHGRGHARGYGGRAWGGRGRKNLTKEALDADLDEWRLRDKRFAGQSLDAELDDYWRKKEMTEESNADVVKSFEDVECSPKMDEEEFLSDPAEAITAKDSEPRKDRK